ncbi:hypothetical protein OG21DRAFT_1526774 [Imleria badia]|nr:hypothetical protein OG21DRAFT_1526774 [Imleria badia]
MSSTSSQNECIPSLDSTINLFHSHSSDVAIFHSVNPFVFLFVDFVVVWIVKDLDQSVMFSSGKTVEPATGHHSSDLSRRLSPEFWLEYSKKKPSPGCELELEGNGSTS